MGSSPPGGAPRDSLLFVTDLTYQATGRRYCDEDILVSARLRRDFDVALCHPLDAAALMGRFDGVVVRNSGPVLQYRAEYDELRGEARRRRIRMFNSLDGKADMVGKQYLVDLTTAGYPVIPTSTARDGLDGIPCTGAYVVKPILGADSAGLRTVSVKDIEHELERAVESDGGDSLLVQPRVAFEYEVSFYFVDGTYHYAMYAPDPAARWALQPYRARKEELAFAQRFVDWNHIAHGIQRVDACRTFAGELLLVEIEDLNPYLSLDLVGEDTRNRFLDAMSASIREMLAGPA